MMPFSPHPPHDLRHLRLGPLGVDRVRDLGGRVAEGQRDGFEAENTPDLDGGNVPEPVRVPRVHSALGLEVFRIHFANCFRKLLPRLIVPHASG